MARFRFHKLAALAVLVGVGAWVATGEFSSVGSAQNEAPAGRPKRPSSPRRRCGRWRSSRRRGFMHARAIRISGQTEAEKRVTLATRVMGVIESLPVKQGQRVKRGDLVMRLDAEDKEAAVRHGRKRGHAAPGRSRRRRAAGEGRQRAQAAGRPGPRRACYRQVAAGERQGRACPVRDIRAVQRRHRPGSRPARQHHPGGRRGGDADQSRPAARHRRGERARPALSEARRRRRTSSWSTARP